MNPSDGSEKAIARYAILGLLLVWALIAQVASSPFVTYIQGTSGTYVRLPFGTAEDTMRIVAILPGYENSGLRVADDVLALNGRAVEGTRQLDEASRGLRPGDVVSIRVRASGTNYATTRNIPVVVHRDSGQAQGQVFVMLLSASMTLSIVLIGFYIGFARPCDPLAWIAMTMLASFGHFAGSGGGWALFWSRDIVLVYRGILEFLAPLDGALRALLSGSL